MRFVLIARALNGRSIDAEFRALTVAHVQINALVTADYAPIGEKSATLQAPIDIGCGHCMPTGVFIAPVGTVRVAGLKPESGRNSRAIQFESNATK